MMTFSEVLTRLRSEAGLSQQEVADKLDVARSTYASLEAGKREPTLPEVRRFADLYSVTIEQLVQGELDEPVEARHIEYQSKVESDDIVPREIPKEDMNKFRNVLLYVLEKVGAKPNVGETVLYKLLYFIDFDYYEKYGRQFIGATFIKNHFGPTPTTFRQLVENMQVEEELDVVSGQYFKYKQRKYMPRVKADLSALSAQELTHINEVLRRLADKTAKELSDLSHKDTPWIATKNGQPIDYQLAMYRTADTSVREPGDDL